MNSELASSMVESLGWALLHFVWQGAAVAALLWGGMVILRKGSAQFRYVASNVALVVMVGAFVCTLVLHWKPPALSQIDLPAAPVVATRSSLQAHPAAMAPSIPSANFSPIEPSNSNVAVTPLAAVVRPPVEAESTRSLLERLRPWLPLAVGLWAIGVGIFSLRFAFAWKTVRRWKHSGSSSFPTEWNERFAALCERLMITKSVQLLSSSLVMVPVVIGWLKPVILVPVGLFTGLSTAQLEAILSHELAHVRRRDYLVNLLQHVVETIFFFHPAVWWVSAQLRKEREHCCDEIAAELAVSRLDYAKALASLEELRGFPQFSISAASRPLLQRIRRIVGLPEERSRVSPLGVLFLLLGLGGFFIFVRGNLHAAPSSLNSDPNAGTEVKQSSSNAQFPAVSFGWDPSTLNSTGWVITYGVGENVISQTLRITVTQAKSENSVSKNQLVVWWGGLGGTATTLTIDLLRGNAVPSIIYKKEGDAIWIEESAFGIEAIGMRKIDLSMPGVAKETYWPATSDQLQGIRNQLWRESGDFGGLEGWGLQWVAMRSRACHGAMGPHLRSVSQKAQISSPVYQVDVSKMEATESSGKWMIRLDLSQTGQARLQRLRQLYGDSLVVVLGDATKHSPLPANLNHLILDGDFTETEAKKLVAWMKLSLPGDYPPGSFVISKPAEEVSNAEGANQKEPRMIHPSAPNPATSGYRVNVHDTHTHLEVKNFRVIAGVRSSVSQEFEKTTGKSVVVWQPHTLREGKDGVLDWPMEKAYEEMALRVEADGYEPQLLTWVDKKKGAQDIVFHLKPAEAYSVQVVKPDGKPAAGATVALAMVQRDVRVAGGRIVLTDPAQVKSASDHWRLPRMFTVDGSGKLQLPPENDPTAAVLICHEDGVLELSLRELQWTHEVKLKPWGKIEGRVQWGKVIGANQRVTLSADHGDAYGYPGIVAQYEEAKTDQYGAFVFNRVIPGMCQVSCPIQAKGQKEGGITEINLSGQLTHADVKPGPAGTSVIIGGQGRTVKGKLTGRDEWAGVILHLRPTAPHVGFPGDEELWSAWGELQKSELGPLFFKGGLKLNADGTFEIPAVLPGSYQLFFSRNNGNDQVATGQIQIDAEILGDELRPVEIGEIKAR